MKRKRKVIVWIVALLLACCFIAVGVLFEMSEAGSPLVCHKQIDGAFEQWMIKQSNDGSYPNINGRSTDSLEGTIGKDFLKDDTVLKNYRYVPGLKVGDPGDLILMYTTVPTRRRWHGDHQWFFHPKKWIVLNVNFDDGHRAEWEMNENSEAITTQEFTNRLSKTLRFLQEQKRPYWTNAVAEHGEFLRRVAGVK